MSDDPTPSYYNATPPQGNPFTPDPTPPAKKPMGKGKKIGIWTGGILAGLIVIGAVSPKQPGDTTPAAPPVAASNSVDSPTVDADKAAADKAAADKAAADKAAADKAAKAAADKAAADKAAADKAAADKAAADKAAADKAAAAKAAAVTDKSTYTKLSSRAFAKVAKNPDNYIGKKYVLYGNVTQFDAATGTDTFRANLGSSPKSDWYEYDTNAIVDQGRDGLFDDVVQDDLITIYVEVSGSFSYDTQIGGNTIAPRFTANIVKVTGSSS